ncbi:MAG: aminoacyl-tRNA hydrolase [Bacteroidetes bacterium]|nr:aminoacyl-tRNA hydrolase [Bacteroidota bacterium]
MQELFPGLSSEFLIKAVRSSGKGGQNVNKVSTKVEVYFDVEASEILTSEQKIRIQEKLQNKISNEGKLIVVSQQARTQLANKEIAIEKLYKLLQNALKEQKPRKKTKPSKSSVEKRLKNKKAASEKKKLRGMP